ncbi:MAG: hypothetical protein ACK5RL_11885 [Acidimicrobiales bacterium]
MAGSGSGGQNDDDLSDILFVDHEEVEDDEARRRRVFEEIPSIDDLLFGDSDEAGDGGGHPDSGPDTIDPGFDSAAAAATSTLPAGEVIDLTDGVIPADGAPTNAPPATTSTVDATAEPVESADPDTPPDASAEADHHAAGDPATGTQPEGRGGQEPWLDAPPESGVATPSDDAVLSGDAVLSDDAVLSGDAVLSDEAASGDSILAGEQIPIDDAVTSGDVGDPGPGEAPHGGRPADPSPVERTGSDSRKSRRRSRNLTVAATDPRAEAELEAPTHRDTRGDTAHDDDDADLDVAEGVQPAAGGGAPADYPDGTWSAEPADRGAVREPEPYVPSDDDERRTSPMVWIVGAVVVAVILLLGALTLWPSDSTEGTEGETADGTAGAEAGGTLQDPYPFGTGVVVYYDDQSSGEQRRWIVQILEPLTDGTSDLVTAAAAAPPAADQAYAVTRARVTYQAGPVPGDTSNLVLGLSDPDGTRYTLGDNACPTPPADALDQAASRAPGGMVEGARCWQVPVQAVGTMALTVEAGPASGTVYMGLGTGEG